MEKKKGTFYLKWPWNAIVYVLLGCTLRILAIPVIPMLMSWNRKRQREDPNASFCLLRTQSRLSALLWAVLVLALAVLAGLGFFGQLKCGGPMDTWDFGVLCVWVAAGVVCAALTVVAAAIAYQAVRDSLFPAKSALAQSIRSQLPHPDEAPPVEKLFAMVDDDIRANGKWFGKVAVGREWVLADRAMSISRIWAVLGLDKVTTVRTKNGSRPQRIIELHLMDDRRQVQTTGLKDDGELEAILTCLRLRAPWASFYTEEIDFYHLADLSDEEWYSFDRETRRRKTECMAEREKLAQQHAGNNERLIFTGPDGQSTSRVDMDLVRRGLEFVTHPDGGGEIALELLDPIDVEGYGSLFRLHAGVSDDGLTMIAVLTQADGSFRVLARSTYVEEVRDVYEALMDRRQAPDFADWEPCQVEREERVQRDYVKLVLQNADGLEQTHTTRVSRRDLELVGAGICDGKYMTVTLFAHGRHFMIARKSETHSFTVMINDFRPDGDHIFKRECTAQEAGQMLLDLWDGKFASDFRKWKDVTK